MTHKLTDEDGYTLMELLVVVVILGLVMGGIVTAFAAGINGEANQNSRYQAQQDGRLALDKMRREIHAGCTISTPGTYNTAVSSVTVYFPSDSCGVGTQAHAVTYCTTPTTLLTPPYSLLRIVGLSCAGATEKLASYLTAGAIFDYLPPNSHVTTLGGGTATTAITAPDVPPSSALPRLHVDMTLNRNVGKPGGYHLVDDIGLRNGPRSCASGVASC